MGGGKFISLHLERLMAYYKQANKMAAIVNSDMLSEPTLKGPIQDQNSAQHYYFFKTATEMQFKIK